MKKNKRKIQQAQSKNPNIPDPQNMTTAELIKKTYYIYNEDGTKTLAYRPTNTKKPQLKSKKVKAKQKSPDITSNYFKEYTKK